MLALYDTVSDFLLENPPRRPSPPKIPRYRTTRHRDAVLGLRRDFTPSAFARKLRMPLHRSQFLATKRSDSMRIGSRLQ
jgi:hypothetical protein